ncbi:hypothetical protein VTP01DRAFT_9797 [Rhizomucor pusillus]|uniref:uncharacterized protein n=1 Tax=Rhizomucor pusillus TaxID=4840 RepID=UPI0037424641
MSARVHRYLIGTPASRREAAAATATPLSALQPGAAASSLVSSRSSHRTTTSTYSWRLRRQPSIDQSLPDFETQVLCPKCEKWVQSRIRYRTGALTWLLLTVFLFWIPFYVKYFKVVNVLISPLTQRKKALLSSNSLLTDCVNAK